MIIYNNSGTSVCSQTKAVKLIDFGCAVEFKPDSVDFGGTSEYMAPEV